MSDVNQSPVESAAALKNALDEAFRAGYAAGLVDGQLLSLGAYVPGVGVVSPHTGGRYDGPGAKAAGYRPAPTTRRSRKNGTSTNRALTPSNPT